MPGLGTPKVKMKYGQLPAGGWPGARAGWLASSQSQIYESIKYPRTRALALTFGVPSPGMTWPQ